METSPAEFAEAIADFIGMITAPGPESRAGAGENGEAAPPNEGLAGGRGTSTGRPLPHEREDAGAAREAGAVREEVLDSDR